MSSLDARLARWLIRLSQRTPFRGAGSYACIGGTNVIPAGAGFPQSEREAALVDDFFTFFRRDDARALLRNMDVLDLGSGYGGRTVMYESQYGARSVLGVEIFENQVRVATEFAAAHGVRNVRFCKVGQYEVGAPTGSMDVVVSYDVLEHVADPRVTMREIHRVLRPGGLALLVFTPYHGMLSHHLGYITRVPGLHWFFSPTALVEAVNSILAGPGGGRYQTAQQPAPQQSFNGRRLCLPTLNGLTSAEFAGMLDGFETIEMQQMPILQRYRKLGAAGAAMNRMLMAAGDWARDAYSFNLACILRKD